MDTILVGVDFNRKTDELLNKAEKLAKKFSAKLWLLHVATPLPEYVGFEVSPHYVATDQNEFIREEKKRIAAYAQKMQDNGVDAQGLLLEGATIDVILEEAKQLNVDLIVCGHQEHNFLYNMLFGSVSASLIRKTKIPVLVYPLSD